MRIYLGFDNRPAEREAYAVAEKSARAFGCDVVPLYEDLLRVQGILTRSMDRRGGMYDFNSGATQSTEFAIARFAAIFLQHAGWAMFADCDVLFMRDPREVLGIIDPGKAVYVVKHPPIDASGTKMDGQPQQPYRRKLWSSVMLFDASHPANRRLNLTTLNQWPGRDLHAFGWLADDEIGELPAEWNHLVGINPYREPMPALLHFTEGVPTMVGYENCDYAGVWRAVRDEVAA